MERKSTAIFARQAPMRRLAPYCMNRACTLRLTQSARVGGATTAPLAGLL